jgi:hypothetical protein
MVESETKCGNRQVCSVARLRVMRLETGFVPSGGWCEDYCSRYKLRILHGGRLVVFAERGWFRLLRLERWCAYGLCAAGLVVGSVLFCGVGSAGASLPDGRAWEMISPLEKNGGHIDGIEKDDNGGGVVQAAASGVTITYVSLTSFGNSLGAPVGSQYVAVRRAGDGWLTRSINTPTSNQVYGLGGAGTPYTAFSSDLSSGLVFGGARNGQGKPVESAPLTRDAPAGYEDYYLYGFNDSSLRSLLTEAPAVSAGAFDLEAVGVTPDLSHVVLRSAAALAGDALEGHNGLKNLYEWDASNGRFLTVNIPPGSTTSEPENVHLGGGGGATERAISEDGSRIVWTNDNRMYVREDLGTEHGTSVEVDAPTGGGTFLTASSDGRKIFFRDYNRLTSDASGSGEDLYLFEPESDRLVDLTVDNVDHGGAGVLGTLGASADGSSLYFVANGRLSPEAPDGNCTRGISPPGTRCNLYLWHEGWKKPRFIASLSGGDEGGGNNEGGSAYNELGVAYDWSSIVRRHTARASRDGSRVVFMSEEPLTGYDNLVETGDSCGTTLQGVRLSAACQEVFLYEVSGNESAPGRLICLSCRPSGARPSGPSGIPGGTEYALSGALYQSRVLSEGGGVSERVFFDSADAVVPQDTNGVEDVYEYENGQVSLLSDGTSSGGASFVDASVNGSDAFFVTNAQLAGQDTDRLADLYDARAPHETGEKVGFPVSTPVACEGEDCRPGGPGVPSFSVPSSAIFSGLGNVPSAAPARVQAAVKTRPKKKAKAKRQRSKKPGGKSRRGKKAGVAGKRLGQAGRE